MYCLIKFQYRSNCRQSCLLSLSLSLSVSFAPISHKEVGEQSGESAPVEESKRSLHVCSSYRYAVASGNGATNHEEIVRYELTKCWRKADEEYLSIIEREEKKKLQQSIDVDYVIFSWLRYIFVIAHIIATNTISIRSPSICFYLSPFYFLQYPYLPIYMRGI